MRARAIDKAVLEQTREEYELNGYDQEEDIAVLSNEEQENMIHNFKTSLIRNNQKYVKCLQVLLIIYCVCILVVVPGKKSNKRYKTISVQSCALTLLYTAKKFSTKKQSLAFIVINVMLLLFSLLRSLLYIPHWKDRLMIQLIFVVPPVFFSIVSQLFQYWSNNLEASMKQLLKKKYQYKTS